MEQEVKRVSDVMPSYERPKDLVSIDEVLNKDLKIVDVEFRQGLYSEYAVISCNDLQEVKTYTIFCGGKVIFKKMKFLKENNLLPIVGQFKKVKRYYDII